MESGPGRRPAPLDEEGSASEAEEEEGEVGEQVNLIKGIQMRCKMTSSNQEVGGK